MTKKGLEIREKILYYLDRNPDGLRIGVLQKLIEVSRNSIYRYLEELESQNLINKQEDKNWILNEPIKPKTIPGYQYQAFILGLEKIGGNKWSIQTDEGRKNFKDLGRFMFSHLKVPSIDVESLKQKPHQMKLIMDHAIKIIQEAATVETYTLIPKWDSNGFPDRDSGMMAIFTLSGGYVASDPVTGNGFAHYFIHTGIVEEFAKKVITPIYGGRCRCDVLKFDEKNQLVDLAFYLKFDQKTPFIDPNTRRKYDFFRSFPPDYPVPDEFFKF